MDPAREVEAARAVDRFDASAYTPFPMTSRIPTLRRAALGALTFALAGAAPITAQGTGAGSGVRVGVTMGGISTVGLNVEYFDNHHALDLTFGTWSFRDLSVSVVAKEYLGAGNLLPFVGAGMWFVIAPPTAESEQTGFAAILHAPIGIDWQVESGHALGASLNVNRALWVRRTDPDDDLPLNRRLVPLPGAYYRWSR